MRFSITLIFIVCTGVCVSQDLEKLGEEKAFQFTGNISLNQIFYASKGIGNRRDPYTYVVSGHLNTSLYGWNIPVSFTLSNYNTNFRQPFNQFGIHPSYKGFTFHAGFSSLTFSPYTLGGHIFLGGGVEYKEESGFEVAAVFGRFQTAVPEDTSEQNVIPAYERWGWSTRIGYDKGKDYARLIFFHAWDDENSIPVPVINDILPGENFVASIQAGKEIIKKLHFTMDFARSNLTRDKRAPLADSSRTFLIRSRLSTYNYNAMNASLSYSMENGEIGISWERIDPGYETLGAYYFNNDLENITLNINRTFNRFRISGRVGGQRNNLQNIKMSKMERLVGSVNVNYSSPKGFNGNASYSTFRSFSNVRSRFVEINQLTPYDNLDTLNYRQVSKNASTTLALPLNEGTGNKHTVSTTMVYQENNEIQGSTTTGNNGNKSDFMNVILNYSIAGMSRNISFMGNFVRNNFSTLQSVTAGPVMAFTQYLLERKLRNTLTVAYNSSFANGDKLNRILIGRLISSYSIKKSHFLNLNLTMTDRYTYSEEAASFSELTISAGYRYSF